MSNQPEDERVGYTGPKPTSRSVGKLRFKPAAAPGRILGKSSVMAKRSVLVLIHHQQQNGCIPPTKDACELMGVAADVLMPQRLVWIGGAEGDEVADLIWATSVFTSYVKEVLAGIGLEGKTSLHATRTLISSSGRADWEERAVNFISEKIKLVDGLKCDSAAELLVFTRDFVKMSLTQDHKLWPVIVVSKKTPWRSKFYSLLQEKGDPARCAEVLKQFESENIFEIDMHEVSDESNAKTFDFCSGTCDSSHDCRVGKILGKGSYGLVYEGHFRGIKCAVKSWRQSGDEDEPSIFLAELDLLTKFKHPNVVQLIGATISPPNYCVVLENCERGDLYTLIHEQNITKTLSSPQLLEICHQAAKGLSYLHEMSVIHRDVKPSNFLVTSGWDVKLTDFTISGFMSKTEPLKANVPFGTPLYMAPEVYKCLPYTFSADVFSFGITINEVLSGEEPYGTLAAESGWEVVLEKVNEGLRPAIHASTPEPIANLIQQCVIHDPAKRPDMMQVLEVLGLQSRA